MIQKRAKYHHKKKRKGNKKNLVDYRKVPKVIKDGITFDSEHEAKYYLFLKHQKAKGKIFDFQIHVRFILIDTQKDPATKKALERRVSYYADFVVQNLDATEDVIDAKGFKTEVYKIKKKMMLYFHGIRIKEV